MNPKELGEEGVKRVVVERGRHNLLMVDPKDLFDERGSVYHGSYSSLQGGLHVFLDDAVTPVLDWLRHKLLVAGSP